MIADDPRHGTASGYAAHRRDGEKACADCKTAVHKANEVRRAAEQVALIGGQWVTNGRVMVWEAS